MQNITLFIGVSEYYFDSNDYSEPIKLNVNLENDIGLIPSFRKYMQIDLRKNEVIDTTSPLPFAQSKLYTYFSYQGVFVDYYPEDLSGVILHIEIDLDSKFQMIKRTVFSVSDMFGLIGGMDSILFIIATIAVKLVSSKIYVMSLLSSLYFVSDQQPDRPHDRLFDCVDEDRSSVEEHKKHSTVSLNQNVSQDAPHNDRAAARPDCMQRAVDDRSFSRLADATADRDASPSTHSASV